MAKFSMKQKKEHYTAVANGSKSVKNGSKFSEAEQIAYARGQRDARNESVRVFKYKNSTPEERAEYARVRKERRKAYKASQAK